MIRTKFFQPDYTGVDESESIKVFEAVKAEQEGIGYYALPDGSDKMVDKIYTFIIDNEPLMKGKITDLVVIGIGGSSLGTKAVDRALAHLPTRGKIRLTFLENCDPLETKRLIQKLEPKKTLTIMISKSGGTVETVSLAKVLIETLKIDFSKKSTKKRFAVVTDKDSPLDGWAAELKLNVFHIAQNVGGRFSVLSAVGLLPLAILGYDIRKLLGGAAKMKKSFFAGNERHIVQKALFCAQNFEVYPINVLFSYASGLDELGAWYVQLWAESLGKLTPDEKSVGLTPVTLVGSIDQHSFLQLIVQGPKNKTVTFVKVRDFGDKTAVPKTSMKYLERADFVNGRALADVIGAQCDATLETLLERGVIVDLIELDRLDEDSIGALLFYFELLTSCAGAAFGINTYDQPGVEFGKKRLLEKF